MFVALILLHFRVPNDLEIREPYNCPSKYFLVFHVADSSEEGSASYNSFGTERVSKANGGKR